MDELYSEAELARFKEYHLVEDGGHNDTWAKAGNVYNDWVLHFIHRCKDMANR